MKILVGNLYKKLIVTAKLLSIIYYYFQILFNDSKQLFFKTSF